MSVRLRFARVFTILFVLGLSFVLAADPEVPSSESGFSVLEGRWVRPDGGYMITVVKAEADGKLDAYYANPMRMPFSKAEASLDGETMKVFLELQAGGYNGSTYTLTYVPEKDVLAGIYYQAVAKKKFEVVFQRQKP